MICPNYLNPVLFFFSNQVPPLLYYSHIPIILLSIFIGFFIIFKDKKSRLSVALATPLFLFSIWLIFDLITWTNNSSDIIMFVWSFFGILFILINFFFLRFLFIFIDNKEVPFYLSVITFILLLPVLFFTATPFNLTAFDLSLCSSVEGNYFLNYYYVVGVLIFLYLCFFVVNHYLRSNSFSKSKILLTGGGTILFLSFFFSTGIAVTLLKNSNLVNDYQIEQYGFFPIIIFIVLLAFTIIKYNIFNIKLLTVRVLILGLIFLVGSQFFFIKTHTNFILNSITFVGVIIFAIILVKYVKKEVEQRELLESLALKLEQSNSNLETANEKLKGLDKLKTEFVSLASHQLRSPLTAIKGYASMILDGDYGDINKDAKEKVERILESSNNLTLVVEDFLNVAKIEQGGMKYEMTRFDFGELVENTVKDLSIAVEKRNLKLIYKDIENNKYFVNGDKEKLRQVIINLLDNSMKYTPKGQIEVNLNLNGNKILLSIKDTGVGISKEVINTLFEKFSRGDGGRLNVSGSGLGLYLVKEIIEAHNGGRVWVESEGKDKGSVFYVEIQQAK